jgi:hypothetical protein
MPHHEDALGVHVVLGLDVVDDHVEVLHVVNAGVVEVAAGVGRVPEEAPGGPVGRLAEGAVGVRVEEGVLVARGVELEVRFLLVAGDAVAVKHDDQRRGLAGVVARGHVQRVRARGDDAGGVDGRSFDDGPRVGHRGSLDAGIRAASGGVGAPGRVRGRR